jgi:hypothetical protein
MLGFLCIDKNEVKLSEIGQNFLDSGREDRKAIFREQMLKIAPFITISKALQKQGNLTRELILRLVKAKIETARKWKHSTEREMLRMIINWGTYSQLFKVDSKSKNLLTRGEVVRDD